MTSLHGPRRRADEFAAFVDGGGPVGKDAEQLGGVVTLLRAHPAAGPRPEFSSELRDRLIAEAESLLTPQNAALRLPSRPRGKRERRLVAAASALVLIGGSAGMAAAAQDALPGDALYPIKRGIERAEAGLSTSSAGKGRDLLHQADDRLSEVRGLIAEPSAAGTPRITGTLQDFTSQAQQGSELLMTSFQDTGDPATIDAVRNFAADGLAALAGLATSAPPEARPALAEAAATLTDIDSRAVALCQTCGSFRPVLELPRLFLTAADVDRALRRAQSDDLDNSHPVIVPKDAVKELTDSERSPDGGTSKPPADAGDAAPSAPESDSPDLGLPTKDNDKKSESGLGGVVGGTVDGLTDGVSGVTTLLPEPLSGEDGLLN